MFNEKSLAAVQKNSKQVNFNPKKQKLAVVKFLKELHLDLAGKAAELGVLEILFKAKTHKPECPLRAIVTEQGSWQRVMGRFLQMHLKKLKPADPFLVRSSNEVTRVLD
ncbi:hypothetical protein HPB48_018537 [Haemaphysalis longicornis]|uniref:Uncharacterized protein n=1 Tax=Haemaphysalis longicornis TaxID=44386 RepID=A0A9J6FY92_HAELO|nr:hypothetical protein HPB48_018537 [Haemaphysalis longicornis]